MAKSIINIDIDDSKFSKFFDLYKNYREKLDEEPGAWDALNDAMGGAGAALEKGATSGKDALALAAAQAELIVDHLRQAGKVQNTLARATASHGQEFVNLGRVGSGAWRAIGGAADASIAKTGAGLMDMVKSIAPLAGEAAAALLGPIGMAVAAGAGGITMLKALADAGVGRQRTAFGLGTTTGKAASFETYANQFMGQDALQSAVNAQSNLGSAGALASLGIDFNKARAMAPGDLAFEILKSGVRIANASPNLPLGNNPLLAQYAALTGDKAFNQLRNAIAMGPAALDAAQKNVNANARRMGLNRNAVQSGLALTQALAGAGVTAQSAAINNLSGLDPLIAKGLNFATGAPNVTRDNITGALQRVGTTITNHVDPAFNALQKATEGVTHWFTTLFTGYGNSSPAAAAGSPSAAIIDVAKQKGVDPNLALAIATNESGLNPKSKGDYGRFDSNGNFIPMRVGAPGGHYTSYGLYQFHESGELGNLTPEQAYDPRTNASVALSEVSAVMHMSRREIASRERVLGVSSWGSDVSKLSPGQIAELAQRADPPSSYAAMIDAIYKKISSQQRNQRPPTVHVKVTNATQSRVGVSINAAALQGGP